MRIFVLGDERPDLATIENALRLGQIEFLDASSPQGPTRLEEDRYLFAGWTLDAATRDLSGADGRSAELTSSEFELLLALIRRPGQAISRAELVRVLRRRVWDYFDRSIDTLVARLRKKIDTRGAPSLVRSVRGVGYVFCAPVERKVGADP